jgi:hypothetical protein
MRQPTLNKIGPKTKYLFMEMFTSRLPGIGREQRLYRQYFCTQYIKMMPDIENTTITGCKGAKKQANSIRRTEEAN